MNRWHGCLWVDSVPTHDGRVISPAVTEVRESLPVLDNGDLIGSLTVQVYGEYPTGKHRGMGTTDLALGWYRVEADFAEAEVKEQYPLPDGLSDDEILAWDFGMTILTAGRLAAVTIGHRPCWPEAAVVVERAD